MKAIKNEPLQRRIQALCGESGAAVPLIDGSRLIILSSQECPWQLAQIEYSATGPYENPPLICVDPTVGMCRTDEPVRAEFQFNGRSRRSEFVDQSLSVVPKGEVGRWTARDPHKSLLVSIKNSLLVEIARDASLADDIQLPFVAPILDDDFIKGTMLSLFHEAQSGFRSGQIYGDALATALAAHLLCRYSLNRRKLPAPRGGLSAQTLHHTIEFLDENYNRDVSLVELSGLAYLSPYHFSRMFKQSTGLTPHQYVIKYRVERAKQLLLNSAGNPISLKQIAKEVGFWDAGHLNRHFKRIYGVSPSRLI